MLRRHLGLALVGLLGGVLVGIVAATPPLFVDSVGSGAVQHQWNRGCPGIIAPTVTAWPTFPAIPRETVAPAINGIPEFSHLDVTRVSDPIIFVNGDRHTPGGLLSRPQAVEQLDVVTQVDNGDVWISDAQAAALDITAGGTFTFEAPGDRALMTVSVRGVYRDMTTERLGPYWCSVEKALRPLTVFTDDIPPPRAIIDPTSLQKFKELLGSFRTTFAIAAAPRTLPDAQRLVAILPVLNARAQEAVRTEARRLIGIDTYDASITIAEGLTRLTTRAVAVRNAVRTAIVPLSALALVCALAVASAIGAMWSRARRNDVVALTSLGVSPAAIGAKTALEYVVPVVAGGVVGALLGRLALSAYAPASDLSPGTMWRATWWAVAAALVALLLIGCVAAATSRTVMRAVPRRVPAVLRWFPVEILLGLAAWRSYRSFRSGSLIELKGSDAVVGGSALSFPLLVFATAGVLVARLWFIALRRSKRPLRRLIPGLALRRLRAGRTLGAVLAGMGVLAVGVAIYGAGLVSSVSRTKDVKATSFVGADVAVRVTHFLDSPIPGATQVEMSRDYLLGDTEVDVLAIDPNTFAAAAYWDPSFSERPLNDLLADLTAEPNAAIVVGRVPTADGVLRYKKSADGRQVHAVARLDVFPTMRNNKPLVVITRDTAHASEFLLSRDVLARGKSQAQWMDNLRAAGTAPVWSITPDMVVDSSQMLFAQWTFVFVRALGVFVGALVIVALLLQLVARQRQQTIAVGILRRMGVDRTRQALALLTEIAILGSVMIVAGVAAALFVARVVVPRLDPLPAIAPPPLNILPTAMIAALIGVAAVSAVVGALIAQASAARANLAEALRDE